ncbi:MAG: type VI secretion system tip protein VgrG, partial [Nitrospirae bacterium]|nr:type VI secretion system tip protein VgrG [Candidatus Manganitrophaceae bacterium]
MSRTQEHRALAVSTPLGPDALLLRSMTGREELGRLFEYTLDLVSESADIDFSKLVGDKMTVRLTRPDGEIRYFNGYVSRFVQVGFHGAMTEFEATLVPWFWLLTRNSDCRIFQKKTVPDIVKEIFGDRGFSDFEESLTGEYREWEYCVQYRETDFSFISRLLEQEGIYYYFKHEDEKHTLILSDAYTSHEPIAGYEEIPYYPPDETAIRERDHINHWTMCQQIQPGTFAHNDFDFEAPKKNLQTKSIVTREHAQSTYEVYDYPGEYIESGDGETYARIRIEEFHRGFETFQGTGDAQGLAVGGLFKLINLPREDQNREYLIVSANYQLNSDAFDTDGAASPPVFNCVF